MTDLRHPKSQMDEHVSTTWWARSGKRMFDVVASLMLILLLLPLMVIIVMVIIVSGAGQVMFIQERSGYMGRSFKLYKFCTMRADRTPDIHELVPLDHPDITRFGLLLRRLKLDELPQLFNIVLGDMSIVGPRPTLPDQTKQYNDFQKRRLLLRPGLTGLAQVNSNASESWHERICYDVAYVKRCSVMLDISIMLKTPWVIVWGERHFARPFSESPYASWISVTSSHTSTDHSD